MSPESPASSPTASAAVQRHGAVAVVTLDNPPVNAMADALLHALDATLDALAGDPDVRAVVLTGAGEKAFAAGANLPELAAILDDDAAIAEHTALTRRVLGRLGSLPQPVVAAVQASAVGGGFELALACDLAVADERAKLGLPEVGLGLIPGAGGTQRLPRLVGRGAATPLVLLGRLLSAREALALGAVTEVAPPGEALASALALAEQLAARPARAVQAAKRALREGAELPLDAALDVERDAFREVLRTADAREGVEAFMARREPRFIHQ